MSSKQEDENYWNQSDYKAFSFDDEDVSIHFCESSKKKLFNFISLVSVKQ